MKGTQMTSPAYDEYEFFASCLAGFEQYLADELKRLRARRIRPLHGGVAFFGTAAVAGSSVIIYNGIKEKKEGGSDGKEE